MVIRFITILSLSHLSEEIDGFEDDDGCPILILITMASMKHRTCPDVLMTLMGLEMRMVR
jgi:hypothetical protein